MPAPSRATAILTAARSGAPTPPRQGPITEPLVQIVEPEPVTSRRARSRAPRHAPPSGPGQAAAPSASAAPAVSAAPAASAADGGGPTELPSHRLIRARDGVLQVPTGLAGARVSPPLLAVGGAVLVVLVAIASVLFVVFSDRSDAEPVPTHPVTAAADPAAAGGAPGSVGSSDAAATDAGAGASTQAAAAAGTAAGAPAAGAAAAGAAAAPAGPDLVVHVVGEVVRPRVVTVPAGSRVEDALAAAGGPTKKAVLDGLNLARLVVDGEQISVPDKAGAPVPINTQPPPNDPAAPAGAAPLVDLNSADQPTLESLPDVGPKTAQRILEWRAANGRFTSVDQLAEVKGIGEKTLEALRSRVRV